MSYTDIAKLLQQDDDPYVRKTAAVCVAKLYDINSELVEDRGFLDVLKVSRNTQSISLSKIATRLASS